MATAHFTLVWTASLPLARTTSTGSSSTSLTPFATHLASPSTFSGTFCANLNHIAIVCAVAFAEAAHVLTITSDANVSSWHVPLLFFDNQKKKTT